MNDEAQLHPLTKWDSTYFHEGRKWGRLEASIAHPVIEDELSVELPKRSTRIVTANWMVAICRECSRVLIRMHAAPCGKCNMPVEVTFRKLRASSAEDFSRAVNAAIQELEE